MRIKNLWAATAALLLASSAWAGDDSLYRELGERVGIAKKDFNVLVEVLQPSMDDASIPFTTQNRLLALLAPMHRDIVTR